MEEQIFKLTPLADRIRPKTLNEYVGQTHLVGKGKILSTLLEKGNVPSLILWGPPGTGKTTLARIIANSVKADFIQMSAVSSGMKEIKEVVERAQQNKRMGIKTILFIDEIHRYNKSQQDALLPHIETGAFILIGATTENPSFEINSALLSRCRVMVLELLEVDELKNILIQALNDKVNGLGDLKVTFKDEVLDFLAERSNGDARTALNALETAVGLGKLNKKKETNVTLEDVQEALQKTHIQYDKTGEQHYNVISALHKSMRGGDANAALYWLGRMLEGGEDPIYLARRIIRFASEDIGLANSQALPQAIAAYQACYYIGMPECGVNLAQAVVYMAKSKKSNELYTGYQNVQQDIFENPNEPVPVHLRNAPTKLMKNLGYGKGYKYTPNFSNPEDAKQEYLPKRLKNKKFID